MVTRDLPERLLGHRLTRALDVIDNPATPGVDPTCRSVIDGSDPNCLPYDIFALNSVNPAVLAYLQTPGFARGNTQETVANFNMTADLGQYGLQTPWASECFGLNFGVEYRKESLELNTDTAFSTGDLAGRRGHARRPVVRRPRSLRRGASPDRQPSGLLYERRYAGYHTALRRPPARQRRQQQHRHVQVEGTGLRSDIRFRLRHRAVRAPNVLEPPSPSRCRRRFDGSPAPALPSAARWAAMRRSAPHRCDCRPVWHIVASG